MFETFSRSWEITKMSFTVINKDKELFLFPILAGIFSALFIVAMLFPTVISGLLAGAFNSEALLLPVVFAIYLGLSVIATFFNVCTVYTAKKRFAGGDATFSESIKFGFKRIHVIFMWGLMSATVGVVMFVLQSFVNKQKGPLRFIGNMLMKVLGAAWSIATIFVVPSLVYENLGPVDAIKSSIATLKKTWGESLVRHFGLGLVQFAFIFSGIVAGIVFGLMLLPVSLVLFLVVMAFMGLYLLTVFLLFSLANTVFNTALYEYAKNGKIPTGYDKEHLKGALRSKGALQ